MPGLCCREQHCPLEGTCPVHTRSREAGAEEDGGMNIIHQQELQLVEEEEEEEEKEKEEEEKEEGLAQAADPGRAEQLPGEDG
ncbi:hypothetical protein WISP_45451 [Willisornis vidua]|uniref:Uncharacterized protein n=1 Tax=Willisornis vidua TaxID=1566151 RepID=A0ABQ9DFN8_9PASS|nr:hypothetical protein WISP_45451 [Willisornis vidua]